jgi:hypothetical protein
MSTDLTKWQREVMEARASLLNWLDEQADRMGSKEAAIDFLIHLTKGKTMSTQLWHVIVKANAKSGQVQGKPEAKISKRTIKSWQSLLLEGGVLGLAPKLSRNQNPVSMPFNRLLAVWDQSSEIERREFLNILEKRSEITPSTYLKGSK